MRVFYVTDCMVPTRAHLFTVMNGSGLARAEEERVKLRFAVKTRHASYDLRRALARKLALAPSANDSLWEVRLSTLGAGPLCSTQRGREI